MDVRPFAITQINWHGYHAVFEEQFGTSPISQLDTMNLDKNQDPVAQLLGFNLQGIDSKDQPWSVHRHFRISMLVSGIPTSALCVLSQETPIIVSQRVADEPSSVGICTATIPDWGIFISEYRDSSNRSLKTFARSCYNTLMQMGFRHTLGVHI